MCFTPSSNSGRQGWLSSQQPNGGIRLTLDLAIGESSEIESSDKTKLEDIHTRIKDLNARLQDIRREQVFQRVSFSHPTVRRFCLGTAPDPRSSLRSSSRRRIGVLCGTR